MVVIWILDISGYLSFHNFLLYWFYHFYCKLYEIILSCYKVIKKAHECKVFGFVITDIVTACCFFYACAYIIFSIYIYYTYAWVFNSICVYFTSASTEFVCFVQFYFVYARFVYLIYICYSSIVFDHFIYI